MFVGKPVPPESMVDRKEIVEKLTKDLSNPGINPAYAILGYRRIGKTSILNKVKQELEKKGLIVVYFDVKERLADPESFLTDLETEILSEYAGQIGRIQKAKLKVAQARNTVAHKISDVVNSVDEIGVEISPDGTITPKIHFGDSAKQSYANQFRSVFRTADVIAEKSKKRVVLILDEFQDLIKLNEYTGMKDVVSLFRGALQKRGNVSYVISGSRVHMLRDMLEEKVSPLFKHFIVEFVEGLDEADAKQLFTLVYKKRNPADEALSLETKAAEATKLVGGNPFYIILLAQNWDGKVSLDETLDELISAPTGALYIYANYVLAEDLGSAKGGPILRKIVREMALASSPIEASVISRKVGKSQNYMQFYLQQLMKYDVIKLLERGVYALVDDVLARCLRKNYS
ncbi:MAG: ATP-binding protein [Nitrososphaerota archaeon]|nr:ATP-binding protein [Nitrososphaerota archaeon]